MTEEKHTHLPEQEAWDRVEHALKELGDTVRGLNWSREIHADATVTLPEEWRQITPPQPWWRRWFFR